MKDKRRPTGPQPSKNLDRHLEAQLRKLRGQRDVELKALNAPVWMLNRPEVTELAVSPSLVHILAAFGSPFGLPIERVPEAIALWPRVEAAEVDFPREVQRVVVLTDHVLRVFCPVAMASLPDVDAAEIADGFAALPPLRDEVSLEAAAVELSRLADRIGRAAAFEARSRTLDEALRRRAVGFSIVSAMRLGNVVAQRYAPRESYAEMKDVLLRFIWVFAGAHAVPGRQAEVETAALTCFEAMIDPDPEVFGREAKRIEQAVSMLRRPVHAPEDAAS